MSLDGPLLEVFADGGETTVSILVTLEGESITLTAHADVPGALDSLTLRVAEVGARQDAIEPGIVTARA